MRFGKRTDGENPEADRPIVAMATALSKVAGLVRQQVIAPPRVRGAYDAYNYAYVLRGFC